MEVEQQVSYFRIDRTNLTHGLLLDVSGSDSTRLQAIRAAPTVITRLRQRSAAYCLVDASISQPDRGCEDSRAAQRKLVLMRFNDGTLLYDAVDVCAQPKAQDGFPGASNRPANRRR